MTGFSQPERRGLERSQTVQAHPDADLLNAFSEQTLTVREREQILAHLAVCPACREVVSLAAPPVEAPVPAVSEPSAWKWPILRWGAVAASAVIVVIAVSLAKFQRPETPHMQVATESTPTNAPAAPVVRAVPAEAVPSAGMKAPEVRYEKVAPKPERQELASRTAVTSSNVMLKKDAPAPVPSASGSAMGGVIAGVPMRVPQEHAAQAQKTQAVFADRATTDNEALAKLKTAPPPPPPVATQTVEVTGAAPAMDQVQAATSAEAAPKGRQPSAIRNAAPMAAREMRMNAFALDQRWQVTPEGYLLSSTDDGKNWVRQLPDLRFTHVQTIGTHVWACGPDGILMHSIDGGLNWSKIVPTDQKVSLEGDITSINFTDLNHGTLETSKGERWTTSDAGKTWKKQ